MMMSAGPIKNESSYLKSQVKLTPIYLVSIFIGILVLVASACSLLNPAKIYPTEALHQMFFANDVVNLVIGLPLLLGSLWLSWRGKLLGLLFWPGALMYVLYNYIAYLFSTPLSWVYLIYMVLVSACVYTLIGLFTIIDMENVSARLSDSVPEKLSGGVILVLGTFNFLRVLFMIVSALIDQSSIVTTDLSVLIADFLLSPAWIIGGVLLLRRKALGYVSGLALLFQTSMLFIGLIAFLLLQPLLSDAPFDIFNILVVFLMGLICFVPLGMYIRKIGFYS
jgi:hypothetical protein